MMHICNNEWPTEAYSAYVLPSYYKMRTKSWLNWPSKHIWSGFDWLIENCCKLAAFLVRLYHISISNRTFFFFSPVGEYGTSFVAFAFWNISLCIFHHSLDWHGTVRTKTMKTNAVEAALCCTSTPWSGSWLISSQSRPILEVPPASCWVLIGRLTLQTWCGTSWR